MFLFMRVLKSHHYWVASSKLSVAKRTKLLCCWCCCCRCCCVVLLLLLLLRCTVFSSLAVSRSSSSFSFFFSFFIFYFFLRCNTSRIVNANEVLRKKSNYVRVSWLMISSPVLHAWNEFRYGVGFTVINVTSKSGIRISPYRSWKCFEMNECKFLNTKLNEDYLR